jgi:hypothetical protein
LGREVTLLFDALARPVLPGVAGDEALGCQALDVGLALLRYGQRGFEFGDQFANGRDLGFAAGLLGAQAREAGRDVEPFGLELGGSGGTREAGEADTARTGRGPAAGAKRWRPAGLERGQQRHRSFFVHRRGVELLLHAGGVGGRDRGVKLHQHLAHLHAVTVFHEHALDDALLQRLQRLGALADDDAPGSDSDDVDLADAGPGDGGDEDGADQERSSARRRVGGGFLQAQGGRQEGQFVGQALGAREFTPHRPRGAQDGGVAGEQVEGGVPRGGGGAHVAAQMTRWKAFGDITLRYS